MNRMDKKNGIIIISWKLLEIMNRKKLNTQAIISPKLKTTDTAIYINIGLFMSVVSSVCLY